MFLRMCFTWSCFTVVASLLSACGAAPVKPTTPAPVVQLPQPAPPPKPLSTRERTVERLLKEAELAMKQGRMTTPAHDNAYDRFRAVQMLEPGNKLAQAGLDGILLAYADRIQRGLSAGLVPAAAAELRQARQFFPHAELLTPLAAEVKRRTPVAATPTGQNLTTDGRQRIALPAQPLAQKSEEAKRLLIQLAQRVQQSDESIVIYARSDAEARWIYKTMKDSVGDYRIRGDIRINRQPAIEFQPPLD